MIKRLFALFSSKLPILPVFGLILMSSVSSEATENATSPKFALVITNPTNAKSTDTSLDGAIVAKALADSGFDVIGAQNLDSATMEASIQELIDKASGQPAPSAIAIYFSGHSTQINGDNILLGANGAGGQESASIGISLKSLATRLAKTQALRRLIILDVDPVYDDGFKASSVATPIFIEEPRESLIAINPAPGLQRADTQDMIGPYAQSLAEAILTGDTNIDRLFQSVTIRAVEMSRGTVVPWFSSRITSPGIFKNNRNPKIQLIDLIETPMRDFEPAPAFYVALARNDLASFEEFQFVFDGEKGAKRSGILHALRREALNWFESTRIDSPEAYWTYLRHYPDGYYAGAARSALAAKGKPLIAPGKAARLIFSAGAPSSEEVKLLDLRAATTSSDANQLFGPIPQLNPDLIALNPLDIRTMSIQFPDMAHALPVISFANDTGPKRIIPMPNGVPTTAAKAQTAPVKQDAVTPKPTVAKGRVPQVPMTSSKAAASDAAPTTANPTQSTQKRVSPSVTPFGEENGGEKVPFFGQ